MSKSKSLVLSTENVVKVERNVNECCICLYEFTASNPGTVMTCKHEYHADCILNWCGTRSHCPVCDRNIPPKDIIACYESKKRGLPRSAGNSSKRLKKLVTFGGNVVETPKEIGNSGYKAATGLLNWKEIAAIPTDLLHIKADTYSYKYSTASRMRYAEEKATLNREITELKQQLDAALEEAIAHKVTKTYMIQKHAIIADLQKAVESAEARAVAAEAALEDQKIDAAHKVEELRKEIIGKAMEAISSLK